MSQITAYTHLPAAAKIKLDLKGTVSFQPVGGADGVPPGLFIKDNDEVVLAIAAQDFGVVVVQDERLIVVEPSVVL